MSDRPEGFVYRMHVREDVQPTIDAYPFLHTVEGAPGLVEVSTTELLTAFLAQESKWLTMVTEAIQYLDGQVDNVREHLPEGAEILPANMDEADRSGFIDGLRAGARHLSIKLAEVTKAKHDPLPPMPLLDDEDEDD